MRNIGMNSSFANNKSKKSKTYAYIALMEKVERFQKESRTLDYPVENYLIDMQPIHFRIKIDNFRKLGKLNKYSFFSPFNREARLISIAEYMQLINSKFSEEIDEHTLV